MNNLGTKVRYTPAAKYTSALVIDTNGSYILNVRHV